MVLLSEGTLERAIECCPEKPERFIFETTSGEVLFRWFWRSAGDRAMCYSRAITFLEFERAGDPEGYLGAFLEDCARVMRKEFS